MESGKGENLADEADLANGGVLAGFEDSEVLQEKCGVVAIMSGSPERLHRMAVTTLPTIVHRGADGSGYAFVGAETTKFHSLVPSTQLAATLATQEPKDSSIVLLQSRYATSGDANKREELQPYLRATNYGKVALVFNGNIWNWNERYRGEPSLKEKAQRENAARLMAERSSSERRAEKTLKARGYRIQAPEIVLEPVENDAVLGDWKPEDDEVSTPNYGLSLPDGESSDTDSFYYLLSKADRKSLLNALMKDVFPFLKGGYSVILGQEGTVNKPDRLIAARDPHGFHPLWWAKTETGEIVVASETCTFDALRVSHSNFNEVEPGTMVVFEKGEEAGEPKVFRFAKKPEQSMCSLELMYFMRVDSLMGISPEHHRVKSHIMSVRRKVGKLVGERLRQELHKVGYERLDKLDVIPIPESGLPFGRGVHDTLSKDGAHLNEEAVILNPDAPKRRSFISKDVAMRQAVAMEKRKFLRDLFRPGHDVVICDDTLIRGTTFKRLIEDLRGYVPGRIHAVLSLDTFVDICPYGIAIKKADELVTRVTGAISPGDIWHYDPIGEEIDVVPMIYGSLDEKAGPQVDLEKIKRHIGLREDEILMFGSPEEIRGVVRGEMKGCGLDPVKQNLCFACQGEDYPDGYLHTPVGGGK